MIKIWYLDFMKIWITCDNMNSIYGWDLMTENIKFKIQ